MALVHVYADESDDDLGRCDYYKRYYRFPDADPKGTCSYGCADEPSCVTNEPYGHWPSARPILVEGYGRGVVVQIQ